MSIWPLLLVQSASGEPEMTMGGWIFLGCAWFFVSTLLIWSFKRVLGGGPGDG